MARTGDGAGPDYLLVESNLGITAAPLTLACWFKPANITAAHTLVSIQDKDASAGSNLFGLFARGDEAGDNITAMPGLGGIARSSTGFSANVWQHACAVFASSTSRSAYLNGTNKGTDTTAATPAGVDRTTIGALFQATAPGFGPLNGALCEVGIWNVALTDDEVATLAAGFSPQSVRPEALALYWRGLDNDGDVDWWGNTTLTANGGLGYEQHPPIIYPSGIRVRVATQSSTFTYGPSGGVTFSGSGSLARTKVPTPSGGATFAGTADDCRTWAYEPSGGLSFGGSGEIVITKDFAGSGGLTFGGAASSEFISSVTGGDAGGPAFRFWTPTRLLRRTAPASPQECSYTGSGGLTFGGAAETTFLPAQAVPAARAIPQPEPKTFVAPSTAASLRLRGSAGTQYHDPWLEARQRDQELLLLALL